MGPCASRFEIILLGSGGDRQIIGFSVIKKTAFYRQQVHLSENLLYSQWPHVTRICPAFLKSFANLIAWWLCFLPSCIRDSRLFIPVRQARVCHGCQARWWLFRPKNFTTAEFCTYDIGDVWLDLSCSSHGFVACYCDDTSVRETSLVDIMYQYRLETFPHDRDHLSMQILCKRSFISAQKGGMYKRSFINANSVPQRYKEIIYQCDLLGKRQEDHLSVRGVFFKR